MIRLGEDALPPYSVSWTNAVVGTHVLTAVVTDDLGSTGVSAPATVVVNGAPSVAITSPSNGTLLEAGSNASLSALASDPVLLVLDEPAAGLRRKEKQALAELLRKLRSEGITILIVEHDMDFVMRLVDRLVVMNFGSKLVEGEPAAVRADPMVQAAYLGSVASTAASAPATVASEVR